MSTGLTKTVEVLDSLIADGEAEGFGTRYDTEILAALRELRAIRSGEFVCSRCLMREAQDEPPAQF
jgi:ribosomal protein L37AE/L43A